MILIYGIFWISLILTQLGLILSSLVLCKKKKKADATPALGTGPNGDLPPLELDKTQDPTLEQGAPTGGAGGNSKRSDAPATGGGGENKDKADGKSAIQVQEPDLRSKNNNVTPAQDAAPPIDDAKPQSVLAPVQNAKFISKGNGVFVDKDGNPISQLAQPPPKDDGPT